MHGILHEVLYSITNASLTFPETVLLMFVSSSHPLVNQRSPFYFSVISSGYRICLSSSGVVWIRSQMHKLAFPQLNFITFPWLHPLSPRLPQFWQCLQTHVRGKWPYDMPNLCIKFSNKNTESKIDPKTRPVLFFEELHQWPSFKLVLLLSTVTNSHWTFLKMSSLLYFSISANRFPFGSTLNNFNEIQIDRNYLWPKTFSLSRRLFIFSKTTGLGGSTFFFFFLFSFLSTTIEVRSTNLYLLGSFFLLLGTDFYFNLYHFWLHKSY